MTQMSPPEIIGETAYKSNSCLSEGSVSLGGKLHNCDILANLQDFKFNVGFRATGVFNVEMLSETSQTTQILFQSTRAC